MTLCDRRLVLSHIDFTGRSHVGSYGVDVAGFEQILTEIDFSHHAESRLSMIDEIGKMECLSRRFIDDMTALLNGPTIVVGGQAVNQETRMNDLPTIIPN